MFFYAPGLLLIGDPLKIIINSVTASLGVVAMAAGIMGFFIKPLSWVEIPLLLLAGGLLIDPGFMTDIIGLVILGTVYMNQKKSFLPFLSIHAKQFQE
jgi:TRAP-type uncharacterized transport system fused permease subunit